MNKTAMAALASAVIIISACAGGNDTNRDEVVYDGNKLSVAVESPILAKIKIQTVSAERFSSEFRTVGTVQAPTGCYAEVSVPFDGRITGSRVGLGTKVKAGQPLFEMSSPDFLEISKAYFQSLRNSEKAQADYQRKQTLHESGITSKRELEEAYAEAENARNELRAAETTLKVYGMDPKSIDMGQAMAVVAPISGEVVLNKVIPGAFVTADSEPVITIADLSRVWVIAMVKERFIAEVTEGCKAEIFMESDRNMHIEGEIRYVGKLVDEETRSVQVVIACDNVERKLKHGMYVSVHFLSEESESIVVPSTAVFQGKDMSYVFVCGAAENEFERREVETGSYSDDNSRICILGGLEAGEKIIAEGGLYLNN